ncbi:MAG: saccharopine dehydrogenase NADP-binding domain-containing protein [Cypionkella sp.]|nr:saccharopine dehydrogenase NADP-binding domain-containing protein [Cypionkella sp.]
MTHPIHARFDAPVVMIGFGSIGRGTLPLILRHIEIDPAQMTVIEPSAEFAHVLAAHGIAHLLAAITPDNLVATLAPLFPNGRGMVVNLSVDVDSIEVMKLCQRLGVLYLDTVIEPWPGFYFDSPLPHAERTNYPLREKVRALGRDYIGGPTAVSCCGANPGMVSWLLKEAMLRLAADMGASADAPTTREGWASLMQSLGIKGVHVAERDTQVSARPRPKGVFVNTWSVDGLLSEGYQPAELGWGTHEPRLPARGHHFDHGAGYAIWIDRAGADTRVRSWCPSAGPQFGFVVTHNEALSISDYYTVWQGGSGGVPPHLPLCLSSLPRCDFVAA